MSQNRGGISRARYLGRRARPTRLGRLRGRPAANRGSVYLAVLGASMIVTILGLSALLATQLQRQTAEMTHDAIRARLHARSAFELALHDLAQDPTWRSRYTHDTWTAPVTIGAGTCRFKLVDEADTSLSDDATDRLWVVGEGRAGDAVRLTRALLLSQAQLPTANLIRNPGIEAGTLHWRGAPFGGSDVRYTNQSMHRGAGSLWITNRSSVEAGGRQELDGTLYNGEAYEVELWVRTVSTMGTVRVSLITQGAVSGETIASFVQSGVGTSWTRVAGTLTPGWTGSLISAHLQVRTDNDLQDLLIDDVRLIRQVDRHVMVLVPGTAEQVVR